MPEQEWECVSKEEGGMDIVHTALDVYLTYRLYFLHDKISE